MTGYFLHYWSFTCIFFLWQFVFYPHLKLLQIDFMTLILMSVFSLNIFKFIICIWFLYFSFYNFGLAYTVQIVSLTLSHMRSCVKPLLFFAVRSRPLFRCSQKNRCERADEPYRFAASLNQCVKATVYPDSIAVSEPSVPVSLHTHTEYTKKCIYKLQINRHLPPYFLFNEPPKNSCNAWLWLMYKH